MSIRDRITDAIDDLASLEVATLTNRPDKPLELGTIPAEGPKKDQYERVVGLVTQAQNDLLAVVETNDRGKIRAARKELRLAKRMQSELEDALGIYDPKDIFSRIKSSMVNANLVAYSRFELEGDSINFVNNDDSVQNLVSKHKDMVSSAQESRKALFQSAINLAKSAR